MSRCQVLQGLPAPTPFGADPPDPTARPRPDLVTQTVARTGVSEEELRAVIDFSGSRARILKEPITPVNAYAQIQWALLHALRGGILFGRFEVDVEDVRLTCKQKGCYDRSNFSSTFQTRRSKRLFEDVPQAYGPPCQLSRDGEAELGRLIKSLARVGKPARS